MALRRSWVRIPLGPPARCTVERPFVPVEAEGRFMVMTTPECDILCNRNF